MISQDFLEAMLVITSSLESKKGCTRHALAAWVDTLQRKASYINMLACTISREFIIEYVKQPFPVQQG